MDEMQLPIAFLHAYWAITAREKFIPSSERTLQPIFVVRFVVCIDLIPYNWHTWPVNSGILFPYQSRTNGTRNHLPRSLIILSNTAESLNPLPSPDVSLLTDPDTFVVLLRKTLVRFPLFSPSFWPSLLITFSRIVIFCDHQSHLCLSTRRVCGNSSSFLPLFFTTIDLTFTLTRPLLFGRDYSFFRYSLLALHTWSVPYNPRYFVLSISSSARRKMVALCRGKAGLALVHLLEHHWLNWPDHCR